MSALFRATRAAEFDRLYRDHAASVYRYAYAVLGKQADAEDVCQQTFLNAYRAIERGTKPRKAENWLLTIAHNEVRRHFRSNGKPIEVELDERLAQPPAERGEVALADVLRALRELPPMQRSALVMREFEGRPYAEIAEILDVTQAALETLLFRARRSLAEQVNGTLTCAEAELALSRRLDGRLPRREARRLKAHLHDCVLCVRFATVQKRQRAVLKGLSVMPIPASLFLVRGEHAAAAVLGGSAVSAGASAGGGAAAAGATGIAAGLVAKGAAVTAAAAVVGGVGYGVGTVVRSPAPPDRHVTSAAAVGRPPQVRPARFVAVRRSRRHAPAAVAVVARGRRTGGKARASAAKATRPAPQHGRSAKIRARAAKPISAPPGAEKRNDHAHSAKGRPPARPRREKRVRTKQAKPLHPGRVVKTPKPPRNEELPPVDPPRGVGPKPKL